MVLKNSVSIFTAYEITQHVRYEGTLFAVENIR